MSDQGSPVTAARRQAPRPHAASAWPLFASELIGTALLVAAGCSLVVVGFAPASPVPAWLPSAAGRRAVTGFLFGTVGALIALSPVGLVSGAHINPVVTLAFWLEGRLRPHVAVGYVLAQVAGAILGALALEAWGAAGASVSFGATVPGPAGIWGALAGEVAATFCLVAGLLAFLARRRLRHLTPGLFPPLYAVLVWVEAPLSGASTNPARTLGPGLVSGELRGWWVYWVGPVLGTLAASALRNAPWTRALEIDIAKVFHFHRDPSGVLTASASPSRRREATA